MMTKVKGTSGHVVRLAKTLIIFACCATHFTLETKAAPAISETGVVEYLTQFGYLPAVSRMSQAIMSEDVLSKAISEFQSFVGMNVTGNMDVETAHLMALPRCGVKDKVGSSVNGRSKRWAIFGSPWPVKSLTYKISKYPSRLDKTTVDQEIARALAVWSEYTDLTFSPKSGEVDIEISFELGQHGDYSPFNGPGMELAHAYSPGPGLGGDAHFDDAEKWTVNSYEGVNLFQVAAHEFGHSLGLDHSRIVSALMAPIYTSYNPNFKLHQDDIEGIQTLYGPKTTDGGYGHRIKDEGSDLEGHQTEDDGSDLDGHQPEDNGSDLDEHQTEEDGSDLDEHQTEDEGSDLDVHEPNDEGSDLCQDPRIDTIFTTAEGYNYVFKGNDYWWLTSRGTGAGYPKPIATGWRGLPGNIDAAFTYNEKTYFFKGSEYWAFVNGRMDDGYPRKISDDFPGIPNNIGAATVGSEDGQIYFYKGTKFWRFNLAQRSSIEIAAPKQISDWPGLPENVDAAFSYNGNTFFFKGGAYYRYDGETFSMDPASPYETESTWFGCQTETNEVPYNSWW